MPEDQVSLTEILAENGYDTALITDTYHQFKPSMNFHRGYNVFNFIRGQERDRLKAMPITPEEEVDRYTVPGNDQSMRDKVRQYRANTAHRKREEDWFGSDLPTNSRVEGERMSNIRVRIGRLFVAVCFVCLVGGGVLCALSPLGVRLSELKFKAPDVFWKLFPSAPLLLAIGLVGLYVWGAGSRGLAAKIGLWVAFVGLALIVAGDVGLYYLDLDDYYIMTAPAYRTFRVGLILLAAGAFLFSATETRKRRLPIWGGLPFALSALAGLVAVWQDLGPFGAALWASFGASWVWLGLALSLESILRARQAGRRAGPAMP